METINFIIEKTATGFSAYLKEVDGVIGVGDTITEVKDDLLESFAIFLEYAPEYKGFEISDFTFNYQVDLEQFFEHFRIINKTAFAEYIGVNKSLFRQYTTGKAPLSSEKMLHISKGLHKLANEFNDIVLT